MLMSVCAIIPRTRELAVEASTEEINNAFERARRAPRRSNLSAETNQLDMTARPAPILNHHAAFVIWLASLDLHHVRKFLRILLLLSIGSAVDMTDQ
jgi:hypothetical protein